MMTVAELKEYIVARLGGSARCIELDDSTLTAIVSDTLGMLSRYWPIAGYDGLMASSLEANCVKRYPIDKPNLIGVTDVEFVSNFYWEGEDMGWASTFPAHRLGAPYQYGMRDSDNAGTYLARSYLNDTMLVNSALPTWRADWEIVHDPVTGENKKTYCIYVDLAAGANYKVSYRFTCGYTVSDDPVYGLPAIGLNFIQWVKDYAVATARVIIGDIRGKFVGIPLQDGGIAQTDADSQIQRGIQEKVRLEEDLANRQRVVPLVFG